MNVSGPGGAAFNGLGGSVGGSLAVRYLLLLPVAAPCKSCVNSPQILIVLCLHSRIFPFQKWSHFIDCGWTSDVFYSLQMKAESSFELSFVLMNPNMMHRKNGQRLINIVFVRFVISETMLIATWRPPILSAPHSQWATHISATTAPSLPSHFLLVPFELVAVKLYRKCLD